MERLSNDEIVDRIFEMEETCCLDMCEHDCTLGDIGEIFGVTRERIRQIVHDKGQEKGAVVRILERVNRGNDVFIDYEEFST